MNFETKHFIKETEIRPENAGTIGFKIDFTADYNKAELSNDIVVLANKAKQLVLDHIETLGIFEGIPYTIQVGDLFTLDYFIDIQESPKISAPGDVPIEVRVKRRKSIQNFKNKANGTSFELIQTTHPITTNKHKYSIIRDNQGPMLIMFTISAFILAKELFMGIRDLATTSSDTTEAAIPDQVIVVPSAGISIKIATIILAIFKIVLQIAYFIIILIQIILLIKKIIEILVPPVKELKVSKMKHLIERGCESLGYSFESDFMDSLPGLTICPVPLANPKPSVWEKYGVSDTTVYSKGYPTAVDSVSTLGKLIDALIDMCNGDLRVEGTNTVRVDPNLNDDPSTTIRNTLNLQSKRANQWTYNTAEAWKRYLIHFQTDESDLHTLDNFQKAQAEYSTEPLTVENEDLVNIDGVVDVSIPFSYGIRKEKLNFTESALYEMAVFADNVINFFGGDGGNASKITARIGVMQISQQQFRSTKLLYATGSKQPANYLDLIGAKNLYTYHKSNQVSLNTKRVYSSEIPLSDGKFKAIAEGGNFVKDEVTDEDLEILSLSWINEARKATIEYAIKGKEGNNTTTKTIYEK